ncbi:MAG: glycosyltransferase [bacterium]
MEVSVIIPTYNRKDFLREALLSVYNQTYKDFEVIVYDDGSTDDTTQMIETIKKYYPIKYISSEINRGPSFARNRAVEAAQGRYIAFLDSDDLWLKNKLKEQICFMKDKSIKICQTDEIWIRKGKRVNPLKKHAKPSGDVFERSLDLCLVSPSAVMMEKEIFIKHNGFDEKLPACEDYDLWLRISAKEKIYLLEKKLVIKRGGHKDQLSTAIPYLDRYRVYSMSKLIENSCLDNDKLLTVKKKLSEKCSIIIQGLKKKAKHEEAYYYEQLLERYNS